jgi:DNA repair protein RadC
VDLGTRALSTRELLALVLDAGRGQAWAEAAAGRVAAAVADDASECGLRSLGSMTVPALARATGLGVRAAARVAAALELGCRSAWEIREPGGRIRSAHDVYDHLYLRMRDLKQEEFHVLLLDTQHCLRRDVIVSIGTLDTSLVHAREVFHPAIAEAAAAVVLVHNHPSGESAPSPADRGVTETLAKAGRLLGIPVRDHVIIGERRYFSFREEGLLGD